VSYSSNPYTRRLEHILLYYPILEFAFEIGSGLLAEVRRLQSLLAERDKAIQDLKEEKDGLVESLQGALKSQEQSTGWSHGCCDSLSSRSSLSDKYYWVRHAGALGMRRLRAPLLIILLVLLLVNHFHTIT
jgi:hypothetical protein